MFDKMKLGEGFTTVPNRALIDADLSHLEYRVYAALLRFRNMKATRETGRVGITEAGLADLIGASRARVANALRKLHERGYIAVHELDAWKGHDNRNTYELLDLESMPFASVPKKHTGGDSQCAPTSASVCPNSEQNRHVSVPTIDTRNKKEDVLITPNASAPPSLEDAARTPSAEEEKAEFERGAEAIRRMKANVEGSRGPVPLREGQAVIVSEG